jgi:C4-dicarboxylate-specific signal transduction histidine kinase
MAATVSVIDANDAAARLLRCLSRDAVLGGIGRFIPLSPELLLPMVLTIWEGQGRFETQTQLRAADGQEITAILFIAFPGDVQAFHRVSCAMIDVTEREQAREALLAAQEELARAARISTVGAVSASIAHEVNQPIGAMVMNAQAATRWLRRNPPQIDEAVHAAERAVRDAMRAGQIVQRTRKQLRHRRRAEPIDLQQVVQDVLALLERDIASAATSLRLDVAGDATVVADRVEMQQVIINLLSNGLHAMRQVPEAGRVLRIGLGPAMPGFVRLSVRDHGTGIEQEHLAKLFNPFFTTKWEGMGIGLSICKTIVEAHGGSLSGRNHDDGGAVFEVTLPAVEPQEAAGPSAATVPTV